MWQSGTTPPPVPIPRLPWASWPAQLSQHHLGKLDPGLAYYFESKISEITVKIGNRKIPVVMNMEQQTEFALGYYQQRAVLYAPKEK